MFHVKLFQKLLELRSHVLRLVQLLLSYLTAVQHFLYFLLWIALERVAEVLILTD